MASASVGVVVVVVVAVVVVPVSLSLHVLSTRIDKEAEEAEENDEKVFPKSHQKVNSSKQWQTGKQTRTGAIKQNHIKALLVHFLPEFIALV